MLMFACYGRLLLTLYSIGDSRSRSAGLIGVAGSQRDLRFRAYEKVEIMVVCYFYRLRTVFVRSVLIRMPVNCVSWHSLGCI